MRRIGTFENGDDGLDLAGSSPSSPRPAAREPVLIGAIAAVLISDLGAARMLPGAQNEAGRRQPEIHRDDTDHSRGQLIPIAFPGVRQRR